MKSFLKKIRAMSKIETEKRTGHLAALLTILIWGTTFISTKILLADFQPVEILFFRFIMGYLILLIAYPHHIKRLNLKQETTFATAGFCGVCLLVNVALTYTMASNIGVIISVAPFRKSFSGKDYCYVCGNKLNWRIPEDSEQEGAAITSMTNSDICANMTAIGKDEYGTVQFEVVCTCPKCKTNNKFFISAKMI